MSEAAGRPTASGSGTRLRVLYRTHAGANAKVRPSWYDRAAALRSFQRAVERSGVPVDITFVVDQAMPPEVAALVGAHDQVVTIAGGSAARSFRPCVRLAVAMAATDPSETVYWFAEDDYLYRPDALDQLARAVDVFPEADYLTLYVPDDSAWHASHPSQPYRALEPEEQLSRRVGAHTWQRVRQTTSTFGVRRDALVEDARLLMLGSAVGAPFDAATWVAVQRVRPFPWRHLLRDLNPYFAARGVAKIPAKPAMRTVLNVAALTRRRPARVLVAPQDDLAMHAEEVMVPRGAGWELLGRD